MDREAAGWGGLMMGWMKGVNAKEAGWEKVEGGEVTEGGGLLLLLLLEGM